MRELFRFKSIGIFVSVLCLSLGLTACGTSPSDTATPAATTTTSGTAVVSSVSNGALTINPSSYSLAAGASKTFTASGGSGSGYTFSISSGYGGVGQTSGVFVAPTSVGSTTIMLSDSSGNAVYATVTITAAINKANALQISPIDPSVNVNGTISFSASNGSGSYSYAVTSGSGYFSGGVYYAPSYAGAVQITITDLVSLAVGTTTITINQVQTPTAAVYRFYNGSDHFFSLSSTEGTNAGYKAEAIGFHVYTEAPSDGNSYYQIYRCWWSQGGHFISTDPNCEGQKTESSYGYAAASSATGNYALYRFLQPGTTDHLETLNYWEGYDNGYTYEETLGYVQQ